MHKGGLKPHLFLKIMHPDFDNYTSWLNSSFIGEFLIYQHLKFISELKNVFICLDIEGISHMLSV